MGNAIDLPRNVALIEITAGMIQSLINQGIIHIQDLDGDATVRRMWVDNHQGVAGVLNVVVEDEGLPSTTDGTLIQTVDCKLRIELPLNEKDDTPDKCNSTNLRSASCCQNCMYYLDALGVCDKLDRQVKPHAVCNYFHPGNVIDMVKFEEWQQRQKDRVDKSLATTYCDNLLPPSDGYNVKKARSARKLHESLLLEQLIKECTMIYPSQWFVDGNNIHCLVHNGSNSYMFSHSVRFMLLDNNPCAYAYDVIDELRLWYGKTVLNQECNAG